jgi:NADPH:quinone reductase-like Zn-dependent oxidoreductase
MRVAGVRELGNPVEVFELPDPREPGPDEVVIAVRAAGVANWDEIVRTGGWDVGSRAPMALGVEAAGTVTAVGADVDGVRPGDEVLCHPLQLRDQGAWAEYLIAPADTVAPKPASVPWDVAGAFPVPALTAEQVLSEAVQVRDGETVLVHGSGGVTGGLIVQLAAVRGARVIATAGPASADRVRGLGARDVIDYNAPDLLDRIRTANEGRPIPVVINAVPGGSEVVYPLVADGGRFATITSDPPAEERGITVANVYVRPDGAQLRELVRLLGDGRLSLNVAGRYSLEDAAGALARVAAGSVSGAIVVTP